MKLPLVSIVVVNYNGKQFLKKCFSSLAATAYPASRREIIMVDNGSTDGSLAYVKKTFPKVRIVNNSENNYCRANNLGVQHAQGEYIAFLNNDIAVKPSWLRELLQVIMADTTIGAVGGKILFMDGTIQSAGHQEYPGCYWGDRGFREKDKGQYDTIQTVPSLCGACVLYRRTCLDSIGLFDEDFKIFIEDVDMALRAKYKGWKFVYVPTSIIYHHYHGWFASEQGQPFTERDEFLIERNRLLLIAKHWPERVVDAFGTMRNYLQHHGPAAEAAVHQIMSAVLLKIVTYHSPTIVREFLPRFLTMLQSYYQYEKSFFVQQLAEMNTRGAQDKQIYAEQMIKERETQWAEREAALRKQLSDTVAGYEHAVHLRDEELHKKGEEIAALTRHYTMLIHARDEQVRIRSEEAAQQQRQADNVLQTHQERWALRQTEWEKRQTALETFLQEKDVLIRQIEERHRADREYIERRANTAEEELVKLRDMFARQEEVFKQTLVAFEQTMRARTEHAAQLHNEQTQQLQKELNEAQELIQNLRMDHEANIAVISRHEKTIAQLEQNIAEKLKTLCSYENTITQLEQKLSEAMATLRIKNELLQAHEQTIAEQTALIHSKDDMLHVQEHALAKREQKIAGDAATLQSKDVLLAEQERELTQLKQNMADVAVTLQIKDAILAAQGQQIQSLMREAVVMITQHNEQLRQRAEETQRTIADREQIIGALSAKRDYFESLAAALRAEVDAKETIIRKKDEDMTRAMNAADAHRAHLEATLTSIIQSKGYQFILQPLWALSKPFKRTIIQKKINTATQTYPTIARLVCKAHPSYRKQFKHSYSQQYVKHLLDNAFPASPEHMTLMVAEKDNVYLEYNHAIACLKQARTLGVTALELVGYEPLLHPRLFDIVVSAAEQGMTTCLVTKGTLLRKYREQLLRVPLAALTVVFDETTMLSQERGQCSGNVDDIVGEIAYLKEHDKTVMVRYSINNRTLPLLEQTYQALQQRHIDCVLYQRELFLLTPRDQKTMALFIKKRYHASTFSPAEQQYCTTLLRSYAGDDARVRCLGLYRNFGVDVTGTVYPCYTEGSVVRPVNAIGSMLYDDMTTLWYSPALHHARRELYCQGCKGCYHRNIMELLSTTGIDFLVPLGKKKKNKIQASTVPVTAETAVSFPRTITK